MPGEPFSFCFRLHQALARKPVPTLMYSEADTTAPIDTATRFGFAVLLRLTLHSTSVNSVLDPGKLTKNTTLMIKSILATEDQVNAESVT
jgi:hypothetical protein